MDATARRQPVCRCGGNHGTAARLPPGMRRPQVWPRGRRRGPCGRTVACFRWRVFLRLPDTTAALSSGRGRGGLVHNIVTAWSALSSMARGPTLTLSRRALWSRSSRTCRVARAESWRHPGKVAAVAPSPPRCLRPGGRAQASRHKFLLTQTFRSSSEIEGFGALSLNCPIFTW